MFDLNKAFGYDKSLAGQGAKRMLGADPEEYIILKKVPNPEYRALLNQEYRANEAALANSEADAQNALSDGIMARVFAKTAVVGWGKKFGDKGEPVKFSVKEAIRLFTAYPEFRQACQSWAENNANFQLSGETTVDEVKK